MKTVLINIYDRAIAQNIFVEGFTKEISDHKNIRFVVCVAKGSKEDYIDLISGPNVVLDSAPELKPSWKEMVAIFIARNMISTHTVRQIHEEGIAGGLGRPPLHRYIVARSMWYLGKWKILRLFINKFLAFLFDANAWKSILEKYQPDIIFLASSIDVQDNRLVRTAKYLKIPVIGMVKSWDNLTSKDPMIFHPNKLIVHNEIIANEAVNMHNYPRKNILISGQPRFDIYAHEDAIIPREEFFKRAGLDPNKKLLVYFAVGAWLLKQEKNVVDVLAEAVGSGKLEQPSQLLVRLHPAYLNGYESLENNPNIVLDKPGQSKKESSDLWKNNWKFNNDDVRYLASTLRWADIVFHTASTTIIESALFDRPIVQILFDGNIEKPVYWHSALRLTKREHWLAIMNSGGVEPVSNEAELITAINKYFKNPDFRKEGRSRLVKEQCFKTDGNAGKRIADFILNFLADEAK